MKKAGKRIGIIILVILLIVAAYLVYVMVSYHRLPDKLTLEVNRTGNQAAFEEDRQKAFEAGMNAHIAKPVDMRILFSTMAEIMDEHTELIQQTLYENKGGAKC